MQFEGASLSNEMRPATRTAARSRPVPGAVVARALLRAADGLGLSQKDLARIVGVSAATMSRLASGGRALAPESKEGELALLLIRVFRSLDALLGGNAGDVRAWFNAANVHLGGVPAARVRTVEGLVHVAEYLDAMRGKL
jgi:DNA-binding XRE family transcriptional regulator